MTAGLPEWHSLGPELMPNNYTSGTSASGGAARIGGSGRVAAFAVDPSDSNHLLCGSAGGGIWESRSRGADWAPRTDFMPSLRIGALAFDPTNPAIVYAGTGEGNQSHPLGQGILRSADGGRTWSLSPERRFDGEVGFYQMTVDPADGTPVFAATNIGMYQSTDGGTTWQRKWIERTFDISMQPGGGPTAEVFAARSSGLYRSANGGGTWAAVTLPGAPTSWARLAVSIAPSDPSTVFVCGASGGTAYLWQRSGGTWSALTMPDIGTLRQAFYNWVIAVAPDNPGQVYLGAFDVYRGDLVSGTWTWTNIATRKPGPSIHNDHHAIAFDPNAPDLIYVGGDGGLYRSSDRGSTWMSLNCGLGITEVEHIGIDHEDPSFMVAGNQDNGRMRYLGTGAFDNVQGGDGGDCGISGTTWYTSYVYMGLWRSTARGAEGTLPWIGPRTPEGYQSLFYPPMVVNGDTVAQAGQSVFVSRDTGTTWTEVLLPAGMKTTALYLPNSDNLYAATNTGRIFSIAYYDGAWAAPIELTSPRAAYISALVTDPSIADRIWVTMSEIGGGQVFRSDDGGKSWMDLTAGLPGLPINCVAIDTANSDRVWVSADLGVYQSLDGGGTWSPFFENLPHMVVADLEFHPTARVLRAATRSRGIWEVSVDTPGSSLPPQGLKVCTVLRNTDGRLEVFGVGTDKSLKHTWQESGSWSDWVSLGGTYTSAVTGAVNEDGRLEVFGRGADGTLYTNYQTSPGAGWSGWYSLGGFSTDTPAAASNQDGRLELFARGTDGALWHAWQAYPNGTWSGWESLGGVLTSAPAVARNIDGRLEALARGRDGALMRNAQTSPGSSSWSGWESLGKVITGAPAVIRNPDGRLEVLVRGTDGAMWDNWQDTPAGGWAWWEPLGGAPASDLAVTLNQDGRVDVFAVGTDGTLSDIRKTEPNNGWAAGWMPLGGSLAGDPAAALNADGCLSAFALGTDGALWEIHQTEPNNGWSWSEWVSLGGSLLGFP